jgi:hypothetical protein
MAKGNLVILLAGVIGVPGVQGYNTTSQTIWQGWVAKILPLGYNYKRNIPLRRNTWN